MPACGCTRRRSTSRCPTRRRMAAFSRNGRNCWSGAWLIWPGRKWCSAMTYVSGGESVPLVFLCYPGIDPAYAPMLIDRELTRRFGREHVFEAGRSNTPGTDIPDAILDNVARCSVLIPLIDPAWVEDRELLFREKD